MHKCLGNTDTQHSRQKLVPFLQYWRADRLWSDTGEIKEGGLTGVSTAPHGTTSLLTCPLVSIHELVCCTVKCYQSFIAFVSGYKTFQETLCWVHLLITGVTLLSQQQSKTKVIASWSCCFFFFFQAVSSGQGEGQHGHRAVKCSRSGKPIKLLRLWDFQQHIDALLLDILYCTVCQRGSTHKDY